MAGSTAVCHVLCARAGADGIHARARWSHSMFRLRSDRNGLGGPSDVTRHVRYGYVGHGHVFDGYVRHGDAWPRGEPEPRRPCDGSREHGDLPVRCRRFDDVRTARDIGRRVRAPDSGIYRASSSGIHPSRHHRADAPAARASFPRLKTLEPDASAIPVGAPVGGAFSDRVRSVALASAIRRARA